MIHRILCAGIGFLCASCFTQLYAQSCSFAAQSVPNPENYDYSVRVTLSTDGASTTQSGNSCVYNVKVVYDVEITGPNPPPGGLYTLQATVNCYGREIFFDLPNGPGSGTMQASTADLTPALCDTMQFNCGEILIEMEGVGIPEGDYLCVQGTGSESSILPVDLLSFTGETHEEGVRLNWTVANETNNLGFFIQRSGNGVNWEQIGFVAGRGDATTEGSYLHIDTAPLQGYNYYRLKQVDYNGEFELFSIIQVSADLAYASIAYAFPSPFDNQLTLKGPLAEISIYDEIGRIKVKESSLSTPRYINAHDWVKGVYIVRAVDPFGQIHYQKLMK